MHAPGSRVDGPGSASGRATVDDDGIRLAKGASRASVDVLFDGHRLWSAVPRRSPRGDLLAEWPASLKPRLNGRAYVQVLRDEDELFAGEVSFGDGVGDISTVDGHGVPIVIDKWGLIQRPFENRRAAGVIDDLLDTTERILEILRVDCGVDAWISFGTLLGAARSGEVIGHDSDVDLCYLSDLATPAEMTMELFDMARALRRAGLRVEVKSGSFLTVLFRAGDGAPASVDIYTTFFLDGLFYATATVRSPLERSSVVPLTTIELEGRTLPAPAEPATLLEVSYGPSWRTPDPSFRHLPGREITTRFDQWFGTFMTGKRDWRRHNRVTTARPGPGDFAEWVVGRLGDGVAVVDVGAGRGADAAVYTRAGHATVGLDFALPPAAGRPQGPKFRRTNLLDLRDVLSTGATLARRPGRRAVTAHDLMEALDHTGEENFWALVRMLGQRGGQLFMTGMSMSPEAALARTREDGTGRLRAWGPGRLVDRVHSLSGEVVHQEGFAEAEAAVRGGPPARWIMSACWT